MDIPIFFRCDECGYDLEAEFVQDFKGNNIVHVKPCEYCLDSVMDELREDLLVTFNGCLDRSD